MRWRRRTAALALVLATGVSGGCSATAEVATVSDPAGASAAASGGPVPAAAATPAASAQRVGAVTPEEPAAVVLPDGTRVPVRSVSTTANGVLDVPEEIRIAGWWRGGSRIGDPFGSTLIAAHVDSRTQGLGPFATLLGVRPGNRVTVQTTTLEQTFEIRSLELQPKGSIAPGSSLHSPDGERRLTLVTCAGPFVREQGGYQNLAVVVAEPVDEPAPRRVR